jgi:hypothetical protein
MFGGHMNCNGWCQIGRVDRDSDTPISQNSTGYTMSKQSQPTLPLSICAVLRATFLSRNSTHPSA